MKKNKAVTIFLQLLMLSLYFGAFYIDIGFSLKPYMLMSVLIIILMNGYFRFSKLMSFELNMTIFIFFYTLTALHFNFPEAHFRFIIVCCILMVFYFSSRGLIADYSVKDLEKIIANTGLIVSIVTLLYYVLGVLAVGMNFKGNDLVYYGLLVDGSVPRLIGIASHDPNITAFFMTIFLFYYMNHFRGLRYKVAFFFTLLCIILTFSRGAYLSIMLVLIISFIIDPQRKRRFKPIVISSILLTIIIKAFDIFGFKYLDIFSSRFTGLFSSGGSGRTVLWTNAYLTFLENPIFGIGLNATIDYGRLHYNSMLYTHNTILEVLSETGLVGFMIYGMFWILIFYHAIKLFNKGSKFLLFTLMAMFFQMLFLSVLLNEAFYFVIVLLYKYYKDYLVLKLPTEA